MKQKMLVAKGAVLVAMTLMTASGAYAQNYGYDDVISSDQLDIDGLYEKKTDFSRARKKLENATNNIVDKKIEDVRAKHERELQKDLKNIFSGGAIDSLGTSHAATQKIEAKPIELKSEISSQKRFQVIPFIGGSVVQTEDTDLSSSINTGLRFDAQLNERFSLGVGFHYIKTNVQNSVINGSSIAYNNQFPNSCFSGQFCYPDREVDYTRLGLDFNGKFYILRDNVVRPYVALGVGIARNKLEYDDVNGQNFFSSQTWGYFYEEPEVTDILVTGAFHLGADLMFTPTIGLNVDFEYSRALTSTDNQVNPYSGFQNPDQNFLQNVNDQISDGSILGLTGGLIIRF